MLKSALIPAASASSFHADQRMDARNRNPREMDAHAAASGAFGASGASGSGAPPEFIAIGSSMRRLLQQLQAVGPLTPLAGLEGEPGTGKHLLALTLHHRSAVVAHAFHRADAAQWLASDPEPSTLRGTLYLERADQLSSTGQTLLLQWLKTLEDRPLAHFQLLVAAHGSLRQLAAQGLYLPDLAFRLSAVRFSLPPLRDHREDIAALTHALIARIARRYHRAPVALAPGVLPRLLQHAWPGNVRELASQLEAAMLASTDGQITAAQLDLPTHAAPQPKAVPSPLVLDDHPADLSLDAVIQRHILRTLDLYRGNKLRAARQLGISRSTLYRLLAGKSAIAD